MKLTEAQREQVKAWRESGAGREFRRWEGRQSWRQSTRRYGMRPREKKTA